MTDNREIAVQIITQTFTQRSFLNFDLMDKAPDADRGFIKMLVMTTTRRYEFIRKILRRYINKKLPAKAAFAEYALAAAACEILFMETPNYAVINSYVNLVKKHCDKYIGGFVNAVLRKITAEKEILKTLDKGEFFTSAFFELLNKDYSKNCIKKIQEISLSEPPLTLTVKHDPALWAQKLGGTVISENTVTLKQAGAIRNLEGYADGKWWVQDYAASLAVNALDNLAGKRVLDLCAAPGGKTAQLINMGASVTSLDNSPQRLNTLKENMARLKMEPEKIICADAIAYLQEFNEQPYDIILLDAPCSGTGVFRRHPELIHIKNKEDALRQAKVQKQILNVVGKALKPEGTLLYCTCSIAKAEGEEQIKQFLTEHPDFQIAPLTSKNFPDMITPEGYIRTLPHHLAQQGGCDSFFIAKLIKVK